MEECLDQKEEEGSDLDRWVRTAGGRALGGGRELRPAGDYAPRRRTRTAAPQSVDVGRRLPTPADGRAGSRKDDDGKQRPTLELDFLFLI
jgi:hypothetical protein